MKKTLSFIIGIVVVAGIIFGGIAIYKSMFSVKTKTVYLYQNIGRGDLQRTIAATGTVEPEELVNVGAQVGGMITTLGTDTDGHTIDYRSPVKKGQVLANIDDSLYRAEYDSANAQSLQAQAQLMSAEASVTQAAAKVDEAEASKSQSDASYKQADLAWKRAQQLREANAISQSDYESAEATYENALAERKVVEATIQSAKANLSAAQASLQQSKAQIVSAKASLDKATRNLGYCVINSPVDGVIIDRRVSVGQTVNSSMSAPSLFLIAKDLKKMQVWVSVNEADIGQITVGQKTQFTVDAFPDRVFKGIVQKIRLNATMSQNVVTYVVEIGTDNADMTLLPYLTANVKFILSSRENVQYVPNAALRFVPEGVKVPETAPGERVIWIMGEDGNPEPLKVKTGLNDGMNTEISGEGITDGMEIITGSRVLQLGKNETAASGENPFMAKPPQRKKK